MKPDPASTNAAPRRQIQDSSSVASAISAANSGGWALLLIVVAASAVVAPMFFLGNASGHDFAFHVASWMDAAGQWHEGIAYPRWAEWANWGFGEPRFIFYPPASWMLGAALGKVLPWKMVPGTFIWVTLILSGVSMWRLAREWLPGSQSIAAAVIFVVNPYQLVVVYYRSDFAELLASALIPLLILAAIRPIRGVQRPAWKSIPLLAIIFAGVWLSNAPAAVIATYSLALILVVGCVLQRSFRPLLTGGAAMALGFGLSAFYILPAAFEQRWIQIGQVMADNLSFAQNFLLTRSIDPEFAFFNWKVSGVALGMFLFGGVAAVFSARYRREHEALWWTMIALTIASIVLMFPASYWLWCYLPKLQFVQFPWRWLIALGVSYSIFLASAIGRSRRPWIWYLVMGALIATTSAAFINEAWWDSEDIPVLVAAIRSGHGYEGTNEYAPVGSDPYSLPGAISNPDSPDTFDETSPTPQIQKFDMGTEEIVPARGMQIHMDKWLSNAKVLQVEAADEDTIALRLLNYPAWEVRVDGAESNAISAPETGRILIRIPAGSHRVEVLFRRTWDRTAGDAISGFSALLLVIFTFHSRRRREMP